MVIVLARASMEFSTNSAMALRGFDCDSAIIVIAFQSLPMRNLPREASGDAGFCGIDEILQQRGQKFYSLGLQIDSRGMIDVLNRFFESPPSHPELHRTDCATETCGCAVLSPATRARGLEIGVAYPGLADSPWATRCRPLRGLPASPACNGGPQCGASIRLTSSGNSPVSSHRSSDAGTRPAALNGSINSFIRKRSPSCFLRAANNISIRCLPMR